MLASTSAHSSMYLYYILKYIRNTVVLQRALAGFLQHVRAYSRCASVRGRRPVADSPHGRLIGLLDRDVPTTTTLLLLLHSLLVVLCVRLAVHFSGSTREEGSSRLAGRRLTVSSIPRLDNTNTHPYIRICVFVDVCVCVCVARKPACKIAQGLLHLHR